MSPPQRQDKTSSYSGLDLLQGELKLKYKASWLMYQEQYQQRDNLQSDL